MVRVIYSTAFASLFTAALALGVAATPATAEEATPATSTPPTAANTTAPACASWLNHSIKELHTNKQIDLCAATAGKPVLIVNTASHCGFTKQFKGLEALHQHYKDRGLVVIGFPSNAFKQEAANEEEVAKVCRFNFGVTFLMTTPIDIKGKQPHPIFQHLTEKTSAPSWNFNKYLVDRHGKVVEHYSSFTSPDSSDLKRDIEALL